MAVISNWYRIVGTQNGMKVVEHTGEVTEDSIATVTASENKRLQLIPLPRRVGMAAKSLDNSTVNTETITDDQIGGAHVNMCQIGRTELRQIAPVQPAGSPQAGNRILAFRRVLVQLSES